MGYRAAPALFLLAVGLAPAPAHATTVIRVTVEQMTRTSALVLHGDVVSSTPVAVNGNPRHIRTDVVVRVREVVKGQRGLKTLTLHLPGGKLGQWAMHVPGVPGFTAGEEVVLFLEKTSDGHAICGLAQGKFHVETGKDGVKRVRRRLDGVHFVAWDGEGRLGPAEHPQDPPERTLATLLAEVRAHVGRGAK